MSDDSPTTATSLVNELARERNREAADRTLLAWVRTSLAMISLGFGIERLPVFRRAAVRRPSVRLATLCGAQESVSAAFAGDPESARSF